MKFCADHWTKLRVAIDACNMTPFVTRDGAEAIGRLVGDGSKFARPVDSLMGAHNTIVSRAIADAEAKS